MRTKFIPFSFPFVFLLAGSVQALGPWRASETNSRGWQFMTSEERIVHQAKVRGFTSYEDCKAYQVEHHRLMEARARERGMALPSGGQDFCAHLKSGSESR